jgi:hypothetical protein
MSADDTSRDGASSSRDDAAAVGPASTPQDSPEAEVLEIRDNIEHTRAQMSETIDELQVRLSPSYIKEQVREQVMEHYHQAKESVRQATIGKVEDMVERVSDTVYDTRRSIVDTVTANPIPSALVGIGIAWLWMNRRSESESSARRYARAYRSPAYDDFAPPYGRSSRSAWQERESGGWRDDDPEARGFASRAAEKVTGMAGQVQEAASNLAGKARETVSGAVDQAQQKASDFANQAQQTASQWADQAQYKARRVEQRVNVALRENPLAVGAVALAIGTAVGLAVPQTRKENEWMGEARDNLMEKAQSVAHEAMEQVQQGAQQASSRSDAGGEQGRTAVSF